MYATDGNEAAVHVAYGLSEFCFIYPITPSSTMAERADNWMGAKRTNCFGNITQVFQMESEAGAAGALHGCGAAGGLGSTFTSSQGLLLMIPNLYKVAGERIPCVFHVAARQVGSSGTSIYCDHSDVMGVRMTGVALLSSGSVQEAGDFAAIAHAAAIRSSIPFMHFLDGFQASHSVASCELIPYETLLGLVDKSAIAAFRETALDPAHPHQRGTIVTRNDWMQMFESANNAYASDVPAAVEKAMADLAAATGRSYSLFDYAGAKDAERVIVAMGAGALTVEETVDEMVANEGAKVGVVRVHLYRPWCPERFLKALPETVRSVAVLDRTKEPGSSGEPLFLDVMATLAESRPQVKTVVGGRYGLSDKAFTPAMIRAVFHNLASDAPKRRFVLGIDDDMSGLSLPPAPVPKSVSNSNSNGLTQCTFWGFGSDGTVGATQMAIKLVTGQKHDGKLVYAAGQFHFTAHKSGGVTVSYLRFGPQPIKASYPITGADYMACHHPSYIGKYPVLDGCKQGSTLLINVPWPAAEIPQRLPAAWRRRIAELGIRLYAIDALKVSRAVGLGQHYNLVLITAFFKLSGVLPVDQAIPLLKESTRRTYAKKGDAVIKKNIDAIDRALDVLAQVDYDKDAWLAAAESECDAKVAIKAAPGINVRFESEIKHPLLHFNGDSVPVSKFAELLPAGRAPSTTTRLEKRGVAVEIPVWDADACVQCNLCAAVCPHAVVRPFLLTEAEAATVPELRTLPAAGAGGAAGYRFRIQASALDCTGCGVCASVCPKKALTMKPLDEHRATESANWDFCFSTAPNRADVYPPNTVKGSQFKQPLFEFCGACGGCGEAPYIKLLTQLFGDRTIAACASGCNVAYSFALGSNPYCTNEEGRGPASAHSLFEDAAEFGFGIARTRSKRREMYADTVRALIAGKSDAGISPELAKGLEHWLDVRIDAAASEAARKELAPLLEAEQGKCGDVYALRELLTKASVWCIGGDGWSCDIGYGGLDHVLAADENLNVLILDTEVYSNTGGQKSKGTPMGSVHKFEASGKATRKKDLGKIFMGFGNIYVASICLYANMGQALKAMLEAEAFEGPSVVLAYSPCLEHGIEGAGPNWVQQAKLAVDTGYWPLYRYNPNLAKEGKNPLVMDGPTAPKAPVSSFIAHENRFQRLVREHPDRANTLHSQLQNDVNERLERLVEQSKK